MSADPRNDSKGGWIHEDEFREIVDELSAQERQMRGGGDVCFDNFINEQPQGQNVQTTFESVEELCS